MFVVVVSCCRGALFLCVCVSVLLLFLSVIVSCCPGVLLPTLVVINVCCPGELSVRVAA